MAPIPVIVQPLAEATTADAPPHRAASHYLWAMLLARIYETLPLVCPLCQSPMRIIAFITEGSTEQEILNHLGESTLPPKVATAVGIGAGASTSASGWRSSVGFRTGEV